MAIPNVLKGNVTPKRFAAYMMHQLVHNQTRINDDIGEIEAEHNAALSEKQSEEVQRHLDQFRARIDRVLEKAL